VSESEALQRDYVTRQYHMHMVEALVAERKKLEEQYEDQREFCRKADLDAREAEAERDRLKEQYQALHEAAQRVVEREASSQPQEWAMVALARVVANPATSSAPSSLSASSSAGAGEGNDPGGQGADSSPVSGPMASDVFEPPDEFPATESALYDAPEPISGADGATGKPGADSVPAISPDSVERHKVTPEDEDRIVKAALEREDSAPASRQEDA
jgi:hypothetical protein